MKNKVVLIITAIIMFAAAGIIMTMGFTVLLVSCINGINDFKLTYDELYHNEFTFVKYERIEHGKGGDEFEIYVEEIKEPLYIDNITQKELNKTGMETLSQGEIVEIYYKISDNKRHQYDACEVKTAGGYLLSLDGYISVNTGNMILGIIICPFMIIIGLVLCGVCLYQLRYSRYKKYL